MTLISRDLLIEPDLQIENGDLKIGISDDRNIEYIVYANKGQIRKSPLLGVEIVTFVNSPTTDGRGVRKAIRQELERDGYRLNELDSRFSDEGKTEINIRADKVAIRL